MAVTGKKLTELATLANLSDDDLIYVVDDPGGSPLSRSMTKLAFKNSFSLTDFGANNWKVFYSDGAGAVTELALGASGDVLTAQGATAAPVWATPAAGDGNGIYDGSGSLTANTTVTMTTFDLILSSTTGDFKFINSTAGGQFLVSTDVYDPSLSVVGNVTKINGASGANDFLGGGIYWATQSANTTRLSLGNVGLCHDDGSGTINAIVSSFLGAGMTVGTQSNHDYFIRTNDTQRVRIENTGEVAIGNITPLEILHVDGNTRIDNGDLLVNVTTASAKAHIKGDDNDYALRVDADNWNYALNVQELSNSVFVGIATSTRAAGNERLGVNGNVYISGNIAASGATVVGNAINLGTDDFIGIDGTARYGSISTITTIDAASNHQIQLRDGNNAVYALFDQDDSTLTARPANGAATLRDYIFTLSAQYWDGAATQVRDFDILHNVTSTSPASQVEMSIGGTLALTLQDSGYPEVPTYTVAGVPAVGSGGGMIFVSDETGGATLAFSDGTNWRRVQDRAIVS